MPIKPHVISVGTTATLLNPDPDTDGVFGNSVAVYVASGTIYVGDAAVTSSTGFPVGAAGPAAFASFDFKPGDALYGITASGTVSTNTIATGV